jgi:hypothetical protein
MYDTDTLAYLVSSFAMTKKGFKTLIPVINVIKLFL